MTTEKKKILVADDEPFILSALQDTLAEAFEVYTATNGKEAIKIVEKIIPDLVILDVMMAEMDGFEACTNIKNNPVTTNIPVILLTAKGQLADVEKGVKCGAMLMW